VPLLYRNQRHREASDPRNSSLKQRGEEPIQAKGQFAGFADDRLIAGEQVGALSIEDKVLEEGPINGQPVDVGMKEALDGAITASFVGPSRDALLGDASGHGQDGHNDVSELTRGGFGQNGLQLQQKG
jgi:hypothetical protein